MNTLFLTRWRPDRPMSGSALRNWQNIRAFDSLGPVDVVTIGVEDAAAPVEAVREWAPFSLQHRSRWDWIKTTCWLLRPGTSPRVDVYHSREVTRWLRERMARHRYDVAVVEMLSFASYIEELKRAGCRVVFDAHNVEGALQTAVASARSGPGRSLLGEMKMRLMRRRLAQAERRAVQKADVVWVCSEHDASDLARVYGASSNVTVVPNAVDVEMYQSTAAPGPGADWSGVPLTLLYPGSLAYYPNEDAAMRLITEVLPLIRARGYEARVVLVGRDPTPAMLAAAAADPGIEVTGTVDSIRPYLARPCVVTLPIMLGSGTRLKILEAFAAGRPVVSTGKGAEGLDVVDNHHVLIRNDSDAIARAVIDLWTSPGLREALCGHGLTLVRNKYSWPVVTQRIVQSLGRRAGHEATNHASSKARVFTRVGSTLQEDPALHDRPVL